MRFCFPFIISQRYICVPNLNLCPSNDKFGNTTFPQFYEENFSNKHFYLKVVTPAMEIWGNSCQGDSLAQRQLLRLVDFYHVATTFTFDLLHRASLKQVRGTPTTVTDHILWLFFLCLILSLEPLATFYLYFIITEIKNL